MKTFLLSLILPGFICFSICMGAEPDLHETVKERLVVVEAEVKGQRDRSIAVATDRYVAVLEKQLIVAQQRGNLEALLALRELRQRAETDESVPAQPFTVDRAVETARQTFLRAKEAADKKYNQTMAKLVSQYLSVQKGMIPRLVKAGKVDEALVLKEEVVQTRVRLEMLQSLLSPPLSAPSGRRAVGGARPGAVKYVRLHIDEGHSEREVQLAEIAFFQGEESVAMKITDFASEYNEGSWSTAHIIDGNERTGWANADANDGEFPHWFVFEEKDGKPFNLSQVRLHTRASGAGNYRLKSFTLYCSLDGKNWRTCVTGELDKDKEDGWEPFDVRLTGRALRFDD